MIGRRSTPRPGRLKGEDMSELRRSVLARDGGRCVNCGERLTEKTMHLAHVRNKCMWGDSKENAVTKCARCHLVLEHNPKSVPPKRSA